MISPFNQIVGEMEFQSICPESRLVQFNQCYETFFKTCFDFLFLLYL